MHSLSGARAKLSRAEEHFERLDAEARQWFEDHADDIVLGIRQEGEWHVLFHTPHADSLPLRLALIAGDGVQNTRAALDYAVCDLVRSRTREEAGRSVAFPVCRDANDFSARVSSKGSPLLGLEADGQAWTVIKNAQPYQWPQPEAHPLATLATLSNHDKHSALFVQFGFTTPAAVTGCLAWRDYIEPLELVVAESMALDALQVTELMRVRFAAGSEHGVHVKSGLRMAPFFGTGTVSRRGAVAVPVPWFKIGVQHVAGILDALAVCS